MVEMISMMSIWSIYSCAGEIDGIITYSMSNQQMQCKCVLESSLNRDMDGQHEIPMQMKHRETQRCEVYSEKLTRAGCCFVPAVEPGRDSACREIGGEEV